MNTDNKKKYGMIGSPFSPGGAIAVTNSWDSLTELLADIELINIRKRGLVLTPTQELMVRHQFDLKSQSQREKYRAPGVPQAAIDLFSAKSKREAKRIAKQIVLSKRQFAYLLFNCDQIGFTHQVKQKQFVPKDLIASKKGLDALASNGVGLLNPSAKKTVRKITATITQRVCRVAHLFESGVEWHCFYFTYGEVANPKSKNHYSEGPHMHYLSHHWGMQKESVWSALDLQRISLPSTHVRSNFEDAKDEQIRWIMK